MSKIARETDLTKLEGDPGDRASVHPQREACELEARMPAWLGGGNVRMLARTLSGSPLATAVTTLVLAIAGCLVAGTAAAVGAPLWLVIACLFAPTAIYTTIRIPSDRQNSKQGC